MTTTPISAELQDLLDTISRDPDAKLFITTPRQLTLGLRGVVERARATQPELSAAERHLLATHRDEVGHVLYEASAAALQRNPRAGHSFRPLFERPPDSAEFERRLRKLKDAEGFGEEVGSVRLPGSLDLDAPHDLAVLALRVRPSPQARLALSLANCLILRRFADARETLFPLAANQFDDHLASKALCNLGLSYDLDSQPYRALALYRDAFRRAPRVSSLVGMLMLSLLLGVERSALEAGQALDDLSLVDRVEVSRSIERAGHRKRSGLFDPGHLFDPGRLDRMIHKVGDQLGFSGVALRETCA